MIPHKLNQLDQGLWGQQRWVHWLSQLRGRYTRDGKICPVPGQEKQEAILRAQDDPGFPLAPEDAADASLLPAGTTLLSQDRGACSLKCNIRCALFGG
jgi:hypothetical protein